MYYSGRPIRHYPSRKDTAYRACTLPKTHSRIKRSICCIQEDSIRRFQDMESMINIREDIKLGPYLIKIPNTHSRVPTPLLDDPYVAVRQAHLVDTDTKSGPVEDLREIEAHIPATVDTKSEPKEAPSETGEFEASEPSDTKITSSHSPASSDSTAPLSPDHPLTQTSPTPTPTRVSFHRRTTRMVVRTQSTLPPGMSARIAEAATLSPSSFYKRYRSSYEIPSPSSSSPTLPIRKRYRGTSELVEDTKDECSDSGTKREGSQDEGPGLEDEGHGSEDKGPGLEEEEEEVAPEGQQQIVPAEDTTVYEPLRLGYRVLRNSKLVVGEGKIPSMFEVGQSSRSVPEHEGTEKVSAFRQHTLVTWVDPEDGRVYTDIRTYVPPATPVLTSPSLEWSSGSFLVSPSSLVVPTLRLDALPPTLFEGYDRDLRELCTRSGWLEMRSFHREGEPQFEDAVAEERRERLELTDRVARMERRQESRGE
ncbi:hypothetical protein Tco_0709363 [Tanacetum coccineum]